MKKRILSFLLALMMVGTLCIFPAEAAAEDCNFYLEFLFPNEAGIYVNLNDQVKYVGYSHCVKLYHKVRQKYIPIDANSLMSSNPDVVSVEYYATGTYGTDYYIINQKAAGTATLRYTYSDGISASYDYTVSRTLHMNELFFTCGFGFGESIDDWSVQKRDGIRFYTEANEASVILGEDALNFPEGAGEFTYQGDGFWNWDPTNATAGIYQITYTNGGKTQHADCLVNYVTDKEPSGDLMYVNCYNFYTGLGRDKGQSVTGIGFYTDSDPEKRIKDKAGFVFPKGCGTFTYQGDGLWDWDSSTGKIGEYTILYTEGGETYTFYLTIMDPEPTPTPTPSGGCYVATAVYGSYDCPEVWTLRRFRDETLAQTWYGRAFIHTYYAISPTLVKWFGDTDWFKNMWRGTLDKMVEDLNAKGVENTPYQDLDW